MTVADIQPVAAASAQKPTVFPIAYFAGAFPLPSETFVYREVRGLRALGWPVLTFSLHAPPAGALADADLLENRIVVYASSKTSLAKAVLREFVKNPFASFHTLGVSIADAFAPGEKTPLRVRLKLPAQALVAISLAPKLRAFGVRHIHCHFAHSPATLGMYAAIQLNIPWSFTGHANDLFQRRAILSKKLERARFVSCISRWHQKWYEWVRPDRKKKYEVIRCGVDVANWRPDRAISSATPEISATANSAHSPLRVLTVCRLVEKKGIDTLLRAEAILHGRGHQFRLSIAGDGPDQKRLESLSIELNSASRLIWLGVVQNTRVPALLSETDIFALPCRDDAKGDRDGIPVVLIEAMACGVPVTSGDLPAIRELIEDGITGLLVDGSKPELLADKLMLLAGDPAMRQRLALAGRRRVEEEFSLPLNLQRLQDRFCRAVKR